MVRERYGLVEWYLKLPRGFDWDSLVPIRTKISEVREDGLDNIYDKIMDTAKSRAETQEKADAMEFLRGSSKFTNKSRQQIENTSEFQNILVSRRKAIDDFEELVDISEEYNEATPERKRQITRQVKKEAGDLPSTTDFNAIRSQIDRALEGQEEIDLRRFRRRV